MKTLSPRLRPLATAILCSLIAPLVPVLHAVDATTDPVGFVTVSASNKPTTAGGYNFLSLPLNRALAYQGLVPVGGASTPGGVTMLTFSGTPFTANQFNGSANAHYLEILNGTYAGELSDVTATTTSTLTLADNITAAITGGTTTFRIWPHWTFATAFGTPDGSAAAILGGASASVADVLTIIDPAAIAPADQSRSYYYNTTTASWKRATDETDANGGDDTDANNSIIRRDSGIQFLRRSATTAASLVVMGAVKSGPTGIPIEGAAADTTNLISNPYALASTRLNQTGLYTGNAATGVVGGTAATADIVRILDPQTGVFTDFFYETSTNLWKTGFTDASLYTIPVGASAAIIRKAGRSSFTWYAPQPTMNLTSSIPALQLLSAVSRKSHTGAALGGANLIGDVNLPLTGTAGTEPRSGSAGHTVVLTFSNSISAISAAVTAGTASVGSPVIAGNQVTLNLSGVTNAQILSLALNGITDVNGQNLPSTPLTMKVLQGDASNTAVVNSTDIALTKSSASPGSLTIGNFRADINLNGAVNSTDIAITKAASSGPTIP